MQHVFSIYDIADTVEGPKLKALRKAKKAVTEYLALFEDDDSSAAQARSNDRNIFRFQDLPPEIRNLCYNYALVAEGPITIQRQANKATSEARKTGLRAKIRGDNGSIYVLHATVRRRVRINKEHARIFDFSDVHGTGILRVNKAISREAREVLYACNTFVFRTSAAFRKFHQMTTKAFCLLENVQFSDAKEFFQALHCRTPFAHNKRLTQITVNVSSLEPRVENSADAGVEAFILECSCQKCARVGEDPYVRLTQHSCGRKTATEQLNRLARLSFRLGQHILLHLRDRVDEAKVQAGDQVEQFKATIPRRVHERIEAERRGTALT